MTSACNTEARRLHGFADNDGSASRAVRRPGAPVIGETARYRLAKLLRLLGVGLALAGCSREPGDDPPNRDVGPTRDAARLAFVDGSPADAPAAADATLDQQGDAPEPDAAPPLTWDLEDAPLVIGPDEAGMELLGFTQVETVDAVGTRAFVQAGPTLLFSSVWVAVDPQKRYRLSGRFRSVGPTTSRLYFGLAPHTAASDLISVEQAFRIGTPVTVSRFDATQIVTAESISGWNSGTNPGSGANYLAYQRSLAFYFDGNTNRLPDWLWANYQVFASTEAADGTFSQANGTQILINDPIPADQAARIVPETTKVTNQSSGGTYLYTAAAGVDVPLVWTNYQGEITGTGFDNDGHAFRPETAQVKLVLLLNHKEDDNARTAFSELKLEQLP